ncbi:MAG: hypothetical protein K940chlam1_00713 [Candidatus Anoxychlamydiales bacterium]|nr:hypothetical protein [Candidatus Anoxychlamydiales bacterium]NGX36180.1 hypothetical protein [Candidatus Anoxychlamydiales bacterium]
MGRRIHKRHLHRNQPSFHSSIEKEQPFPNPSQKSGIYSIGERFSKGWQNTPNIAKIALYGLAGYGAVQGLINNNNEGFVNDVFYVPIFEEIIFRVLFTETVRASQSIYNYMYKRGDLTETQKKTQEQFRVHVVAAIFAFYHPQMGIVKQLLCYYLFGRATGYLKEKTGAIFAPLALHVVHNFVSAIKDPYYVGRTAFSRPEIIVAFLTSRHLLLHVPVLIALNKKFLPIPESLMPNFVKTTTTKIKDFFSRKFSFQTANER